MAVRLKKVDIRGKLSFPNPPIGPGEGPNVYELKSEMILVETGELVIGTEAEPYMHEAIITLLGIPTSETHSYSNDVVAGNKILFVTGKFTAWGKDLMDGEPYWTRLYKPCVEGESTIWLAPGLDWQPGYEIAIPPTGYDENQHESFTIVKYDDLTGETTLDQPLMYNHYGAADFETFETFNYDLRGEVILLTRNIKIQGEEGVKWGGQLMVAEWIDQETGKEYKGEMTLKYV